LTRSQEKAAQVIAATNERHANILIEPAARRRIDFALAKFMAT
jgi:hypothetical protein